MPTLIGSRKIAHSRNNLLSPYDLLSDVDQEVGTVYGVLSTEHPQYPAKISYLIDPEGHIEQIYPQVAPNTHPDQMLKDL